MATKKQSEGGGQEGEEGLPLNYTNNYMIIPHLTYLPQIGRGTDQDIHYDCKDEDTISSQKSAKGAKTKF